MDLTITDEPENQRYAARLGGQLAGVISYVVDGPMIATVHTEVGPAYEGQGVGSQLARFALDDTRRRGREVRPLCPFIHAWIQRHPDYADLVMADT